MARVSTRFNVPNKLQDDLAAAAQSQSLSRSEIVNRALAAALQTFPTVIAYRAAAQEPIPVESTAMTYTVEPAINNDLQALTERLGMAKDLILRLALDYHLNSGNSHV